MAESEDEKEQDSSVNTGPHGSRPKQTESEYRAKFDINAGGLGGSKSLGQLASASRAERNQFDINAGAVKPGEMSFEALGRNKQNEDEHTAFREERTKNNAEQYDHPETSMVFTPSPKSQQQEGELNTLRDKYTAINQQYQDALVNNDPTAPQINAQLTALKRQYEKARRDFATLQRQEQTAFNKKKSKAIALRDQRAMTNGKVKDPATGEWIDKPEGYQKPDGVLKQFAKDFTSASNKPQLKTDRSANAKPSTNDMWNADTYFSDEDLKAIKGTTLTHSRGW
jgi:hypothetical protein